MKRITIHFPLFDNMADLVTENHDLFDEIEGVILKQFGEYTVSGSRHRRLYDSMLSPTALMTVYCTDAEYAERHAGLQKKVKQWGRKLGVSPLRVFVEQVQDISD